MSAQPPKTRRQLWEEERQRRRDAMRDGLNELLTHLKKNPMAITQVVKMAKTKWAIPHHVTRQAVDTWVREGRLGERKEPCKGRGRPRRLVGGGA